MGSKFVRDTGPLTARALVIAKGDLFRFVAKVHALRSGCWRWLGGKDKKGYGKFWWNGKTGRAHRFAYFYWRGDIKKGKEPDHLCRNTWCVNPDCLEIVTRHTNLVRADSPVGRNARKTHCGNGHVFNKKNTYLVNRNGRTHRHCRVCIRERKKKAYWENPEKFRALVRRGRAKIR